MFKYYLPDIIECGIKYGTRVSASGSKININTKSDHSVSMANTNRDEYMTSDLITQFSKPDGALSRYDYQKHHFLDGGTIKFSSDHLTPTTFTIDTELNTKNDNVVDTMLTVNGVLNLVERPDYIDIGINLHDDTFPYYFIHPTI